MELLQLQYFQTTARLENMTAAAAHYHIPQPAMSQMITRLEKELGTKLFDRRRNHIFLNENGRRFLAHVDVILAEVEKAKRIASSEENGISGEIRLLAAENRRFAFQCVSEFSSRYPEVNFSVSHEYNADPLSEYDLCISASPSYRNLKASMPLIREKIVLNVHENHWAADRKKIPVEALKNEKFITMSSDSTLYRLTVSNCRNAGFEPKIPFICDDPYFVRKYVAENMGIAFAPSVSWAGRFRENTRLVEPETPIVTVSYLCWDERRYQTAAVRNFRDFLKEQASLLSE